MSELTARVTRGESPDNIWPVWTLFAMELWRAHAIEGERTMTPFRGDNHERT